MPLSPYLSFAGNCADAIAFYQKTLGAELLYKINFGEMPKSAQDSEEGCPSGMKFPDTAIAHANLRVAGSDIMMSDSAPDGNGKIEMDWQETFWAHGFGKVSDQYGVPWMINVVKQQQPPTE